ncbi:MAG TPA: isoamylase early set domain-containing protein [Gemmatimonadales bacterium]|nr:isoamylase early set domain-containing protein [Gemmatimonadales bacterium]
MTAFHPLVKRLLDGELTLGELPAELRAEGQAALRILAAVDRSPVRLPEALDARVMAQVRRRRASAGSLWRWMAAPRVPVWAAGALAAAAAVLVLVVSRPGASAPPAASVATAPESVFVKFVLYAPDAKRVSVAGTFNAWDASAAPLARAGSSGVWTATLALPVGQHQYAFIVDGQRWIADPAAPAVDDGFGRRNSVLSVSRNGVRTL